MELDHCKNCQQYLEGIVQRVCLIFLRECLFTQPYVTEEKQRESENLEESVVFDWLRSVMNTGSILGYFFQAVPITCFVGIIYTIIRATKIKRKKVQVDWLKEIVKLLFVSYLTGLISLIILPANFWLDFYDGIFLGWWDEILPIVSFGGFNLVPSLIKALSGNLTIGSWVKTMLLWNIAMFLPLGFFLPFVVEKVNRKNIFVVAIVVPLGVEILQMIFGRSFDVDDLICNFIGIVIGFFIGVTIKRHNEQRAER